MVSLYVNGMNKKYEISQIKIRGENFYQFGLAIPPSNCRDNNVPRLSSISIHNRGFYFLLTQWEIIKKLRGN